MKNITCSWAPLFWLALLLPNLAVGQEETAEKNKEKLFWLHAIEEYRGRFAMGSGSFDTGTDAATSGAVKREDESDHDLRLYVEGGARDAEDRFSGRLAVGLWWDLDGVPDQGFTTLGSMRDGHAFSPEVYSLYGEYHANAAAGRRALMRLARVGRQTAEYGLPATFDGATVRMRPLAPYLELFLFGGRTVHFFESDAELFEDWVASLGAEIRPVRDVRLVLDYRLSVEDQLIDAAADDEGEAGIRESVQDHGYGLTGWYRPAAWARVKAYGRGLNEYFAHAGGAGRLLWDTMDLGFDFKVDAQLVTLDEVNEMLNPFYAVLGQSLPNLRWKADLFKNFETKKGDYAVHAGWAGRAVLEDATGPFNRDFGRVYLLAAATDIVVKGPFVALVADAHFTGLSPDFTTEGFITAGGSAGYKNKKLKAEVGSYYQRYKYRYYQQVDEIADVRTWSGSVSYKLTHWLKAKLKYEYEQFDWDVHTVIFSLSQHY